MFLRSFRVSDILARISIEILNLFQVLILNVPSDMYGRYSHGVTDDPCVFYAWRPLL